MEKSIISKILIVGSGITGSVTASLIRHEANTDISIWEKEKQAGGRFLTFHNPARPNCVVDLGAQYISTTLEFIRSHARFYDELLDQNKLVPLESKIVNFRKLSESKTNFIAPEGTESLVQHFLKKSGAKLHLEHEVSEINLKTNLKQWEIKTTNGTIQNFDAVILTMPIPEVLKLCGTIQEVIDDADDVKVSMEEVTFSSRYAVGLLYDEPKSVLEDMPWSVKYFPNDEVICFATIDNHKRGKEHDLPSILVHTSTQFPLKHSHNKDDEVKKIILDHLKCLIPELPEPDFVQLKKWKHSQVTDAYIDNPGCIVLNEHPCLICGGDSFTQSDFNGSITSAVRIVEELLKHVTFSRTGRNHHGKTTHLSTPDH